ncbi:hypothetical protein F5890DRAFT_1538469 [Lentinula detonsa]|uniref:DUF6697 domain-containing protein n=1 Tax=Lentinula detonsa TaxID=2804962 RepID=A0AA38PSM5_9AGAR|nr:hypothetical protein F5890DRAFT_1538469 [Lentinula detonsa]
MPIDRHRRDHNLKPCRTKFFCAFLQPHRPPFPRQSPTRSIPPKNPRTPSPDVDGRRLWDGHPTNVCSYHSGNDLILLVHFPVAIRELCLIIPNFDRHPNLMREPGDSGILFTARPERELTLESCSVFVKKESNNLNALWDYMGEYKIFQREKWVERCMEEGDMSSCLRRFSDR